MREFLDEIRVAVDLRRAQREGTSGLARRQQQRLTELVAYARARSPFYRHLYHGLPTSHVILRDLPPVTKPELMASFDDWVTDPAVTRADVEAFVSDPARVGHPFRGGLFVCTSSGTTGRPGLFVHDAAALAVYRAILDARIDVAWLTRKELLAFARRGLRYATIVGTGAHFGGAGWMERERRRLPWRLRAYRTFSVQRPLPELVAALNDFDPTLLLGYPSVLDLLTEEQAAGRLRLRPSLIATLGESRGPGLRERMAAAFGCSIQDAYSASECLVGAFSCAHDWLHVSSDWVILEPVDEAFRPTPPGESSYTVLLTNLANRIQPIIRYDLGDSVVARPDPCPCGNPLPAIRVSGRCDDVLHLSAREGRTIAVSPMAVGIVIEEAPGVHRGQLIQESPNAVRLRLDLDPGTDAESVWSHVVEGLRRYLSEQGAEGIEVIRASEPPEQSPGSGKFRQVIARPRRDSA